MCGFTALCLASLIYAAQPPGAAAVAHELERVRGEIYANFQQRNKHCFAVQELRLQVCGERDGVVTLTKNDVVPPGNNQRKRTVRAPVFCSTTITLRPGRSPLGATGCPPNVRPAFSEALVLSLERSVLVLMLVSDPRQWLGESAELVPPD